LSVVSVGVLSGRGLCDELITRPEESYRLCCVVVCNLETSRIGAPYVYDISHLRVKYCIYSKGKAIPLQAWTSPEDSRRLRFTDCKTVDT
jgi:hypothetical protein